MHRGGEIVDRCFTRQNANRSQNDLIVVYWLWLAQQQLTTDHTAACCTLLAEKHNKEVHHPQIHDNDRLVTMTTPVPRVMSGRRWEVPPRALSSQYIR